MVKNRKYTIPQTSARGKTLQENNDTNTTESCNNNNDIVDKKPKHFLKSEFMGNVTKDNKTKKNKPIASTIKAIKPKIKKEDFIKRPEQKKQFKKGK
jgi:hypothetical protein